MSPTWGWAPLFVLLLAILALLFRKGKLRVGPVLLFDAVRTTRRSRLTLFRVLYCLFLLTTLFAAYTRWFPQDFVAGVTSLMDERHIHSRDMALFAGEFFQSFLLTQFLGVALLAPVLAGGAISEEREKGTLELLYVTHLEPREILLGKLLSRVGHLVLLLLAGVPVLAILQLLGGVDPALLLFAYAGTFLILISTTAITLFCSAGTNRTHVAVFQAYGLAYAVQMMIAVPFLPIFCIDWTIGLPEDVVYVFGSVSYMFALISVESLSARGQLWDKLSLLLLGQGLGQGAITWYFLRKAEDRLRKSVAHRAGQAVLPTEVNLVPETAHDHPPVSDRPIYWKEIHVEPGVVPGRDYRDLYILFVVLAGTYVLTLATIAVMNSFFGLSVRELVAQHVSVLLPAFASFIMLRLALRGSGSLSGERDRQTLDSLLTTSLTNEEILKEKWLGCLGRQRALLWILAALLLVGLFTGSSIWTLPFLVLSLLVQLAFALTLGMYCSLVCSSTFRATSMTLVALLAIGLGHWLLHPIVNAVGVMRGWSETTQDLLTALHTYGLTPPVNLITLVSLGHSADGFEPIYNARERFLAALAGIFLYAVLTAALWWRIRARFGPLTGRLR